MLFVAGTTAPKAESIAEPTVATAKPADDVEDVEDDGEGLKVLSKKEKEKLKKEREKVCYFHCGWPFIKDC